MLKSTESLVDSSSTLKENRVDIWTLATKKQPSSEGEDKAVESVLLFVGGKESGKTSLILRFLDREDPPTPTIALEYTFGRRSRPMSSIKDVVHIWELAGGVMLSNLVEIPLSDSNIQSCACILSLDLSRPNLWIHLLDTFLSALSDRVDKILDGLQQRGSQRPSALRARCLKKYGTGHLDMDVIRPSVIPLVIVGTKFDLLATTDHAKLVTRFLRFVAHMNGASLLFTSLKDESSIMNIKSILNQLAFKNSVSKKNPSFDPSRPIFIPAGQDTLSQIGSLPSAEKHGVNATSYEGWKKEFARMFPQDEVSSYQSTDESKFPETTIDQLRLKKDEELEAFRNDAERKLKEKAFSSQFSQWSVRKEKRKGTAYSRTQAAKLETAS